MNCKQVVTHMVQEGDSFYNIAQHYQIPVEVIIQQNPGLDPYNLQVGTTLVICLDENPEYQEQWGELDWSRVMELNNAMRKVWEQHVYWDRMLMISIIQRLRDQMAVTGRLLENPGDIAEVFGEFYPKEITDAIAGLLMEHLQTGSALVTALRDGKTAEAETLTRRWYENANQMARAFASINPQYQMEELGQMLYRHLALIQQDVAAYLAGDYEAGIRAFDEMEEEVLRMADYFTSGLVMQFPQKF